MKNVRTELLAAAGIQQIEELLPYCSRQRTAIYRAVRHQNPPLWLLEGLAAWYAKNKPLSPEERDMLFRRLLHDLWPKSPVEPGSSRGPKRPPKARFLTHAKNSLAAAPAGLTGQGQNITKNASAAAIRGTVPPQEDTAGRWDSAGGGEIGR